MKKIPNFIACKFKQITTLFCLGFSLAIIVNLGIGFSLSSLSAQSIRPEAASSQVQQQVSFLSLENEYLNRESGKVSPQNTLLLRLIRYHDLVKSRPLTYRFDWQLTFADYFGINEPIRANRYPGHRTLVENPLEGDRQVITSLTREQRNQLIDSLLAVYAPKNSDVNSVSSPRTTKEPELSSPQPQFPQRGSADLLKILPTKAR